MSDRTGARRTAARTADRRKGAGRAAASGPLEQGAANGSDAPVADDLAGLPPGVARATYRGVRWQRNPDGAVGWYNDGLDRWVRWRPSGDAPPPPPRWVAAGMSAPIRRQPRARWRSPYRLVPIVLVAVVCVIGVAQALRSTPNPVAAERAAAEKLVGRCLAQKGTAGGHPAYSSTAVSCDAKAASVKVVSVISGTPDSQGRWPLCPEHTTAVQLAYPGVRYPHVECVTPVGSSS